MFDRIRNRKESGKKPVIDDATNISDGEMSDKENSTKKKRKKKPKEVISPREDSGVFSSNALENEGDVVEESHSSDIDNSPKLSPTKRKGFFNKFKSGKSSKKDVKNEGKQIDNDDDDDVQQSSENESDSHSIGQESNVSNKKRQKKQASQKDWDALRQAAEEQYALLVQQGAGPWIEGSAKYNKKSQHSKIHSFLHVALLTATTSAIFSLEILCFWQASCAVEWWRPHQAVDPAIPVFASRSLVPTAAVLLVLVIPSGYASKFSENQRSIGLWAVVASLFALHTIVQSAICFARAAAAGVSTAQLWEAGGDGMYLAKRYYTTENAFRSAYHTSHVSFAFMYIWMGMSVTVAILFAVRLAASVRAQSRFPDAAGDDDDDDL